MDLPTPTHAPTPAAAAAAFVPSLASATLRRQSTFLAPNSSQTHLTTTTTNHGSRTHRPVLHANAADTPNYAARAPRGTPLLDTIKSPADLRNMPVSALAKLAHELRWETINVVAKTGGHLGASLGVIELTVALHYVFATPEDRLIWDVAHQAYPHKILTGRRDRMTSLRKAGGLSGFTKRTESEYDVFGAGHSSTSISAAHGMAIARDLAGRRNHTIAVIGDGAITGGMAYEAMNSAGYLKTRTIVILNDNGQVSLPTGTKSAGGVRPSSALSDSTSRLVSSRPFLDFRNAAKSFAKLFPEDIQGVAARVDEYTRGIMTQGEGTLFEELGFYYVGPVDGHNIENLVTILENVRDIPGQKPVLIHVKTDKGKGYAPAEAALDRYHGVAKFDVATGKQFKTQAKTPSYTSVFAKTLIEHADNDRKVVAITAAMPGGTGLNLFGERFPSRCFDVGIAEQHAVTMAAGMATEGFRPFCCIYSTFLQRGYDQLIHDVSIQKLPVRFILDRAGLVGNDGPTHHGTFDLAYMGCIPNMTIMAPSDEYELQNMIATATEIDDHPCAVRYPRGNGIGLSVLNDKFSYNLTAMPKIGAAVPIGKGRVIKRRDPSAAQSSSVAILSIGTRLLDSVKAAEILEAKGIPTTVADARFMKPLDLDLIRDLVADHGVLITVEEGSIGGFGDHVLHFLALEGLLDSGTTKVRPMVVPDRYIDHGSQSEQYEQAGLSCNHIAATGLRLAGRTSDAMQLVNCEN